MDKNLDYQQAEEALKYLTENYSEQHSLFDAADETIMNKHFETLAAWAGISGKTFLQHLTNEELKKQIKQPIINDTVNAHIKTQIFTAEENATQQIEYGLHPTLFGNCLIASSDDKICGLHFANHNEDELIAQLHSDWKNASITQNQTTTQPFVEKLFSNDKKSELSLLLKGTPFQLKVWQALLKIPFGALSSYQHIADAIGQPSATRTVGTAIGQNPVAYLIPCHRIIRQEAIIGEFRWGTTRKKMLIGWERANSNL